MTPQLKAKFAELKGAREKAAQGEWKPDPGAAFVHDADFDIHFARTPRIEGVEHAAGVARAKQDAEFITLAANNWLALIDALEVAFERLHKFAYESPPTVRHQDFVYSARSALEQIAEKMGVK